MSEKAPKHKPQWRPIRDVKHEGPCDIRCLQCALLWRRASQPKTSRGEFRVFS